MGKQKQNRPSISHEFSDALNREKVMAKGKEAQPRGIKVAPSVSVDADNLKSRKTSNSDNNNNEAAPKRKSSAGLKRPSDAASTGPLKRTSIAGMKNQDSIVADPVQDAKEGQAKDPEEDANGLYDILVQTRRCEDLCSGLGLTMGDIRKMKRKYDNNDMYHSGEINQAEFFFMINEEQRPLTMGILNLGDIPATQKFLSFDQYLLCVVNFAVLTKPELYQFVFDLYDDDQSGALDEREFTKMSLQLQSRQFHFPANVTMAIKMLEGKEGRAAFAPDDGLVDLGEFMKFAKNFPVAFYPIMNMQKNVRASTLGESRWSRITANKLKVQELVSYMRRHRVRYSTFVSELASFTHLSLNSAII
ncbi:hypothetical protein V7S43_000188 [Phytophthora oleae]|uniref:EF-hand domain-containing protein n=1 Tax=Phytophthora oleae TaxID=2107226 RepID=A0ABD3G880_9STRA